MAFTLTDEELRKNLKLLGEDVGPITPTTRRAYQRKLETLMKTRGENRNALNALSSDDSEIEQSGAADISRRKKRHSQRIYQAPMTQLNKLLPSSTEKPHSQPHQHDIFKKPFAKSPVVANKNLRLRQNLDRSIGNSSTDFEASDTDGDADSDSFTNRMRTFRLRNHHTPETPKISLFNAFRYGRNSVQVSTPNGDECHNSRKNNSRYMDYRSEEYDKTFLSGNRGYMSILSKRKHAKELLVSFYNRMMHKLRTYSDTSANGFVTDIVNGEFQNEKVRGKTTNYSHCVSGMLVFAAAAFFVILGLIYMSAVQRNQLTALPNSKSYLDSHICESHNDSGCIPEKYFKYVLLASRDLYDVLAAVAGEYECQSGLTARNLTLSSAKVSLKQLFENQDLEVDEELPFDTVFEYTILLTTKYPDWGIRILSCSGQAMNNFEPSNIQEVCALETTRASKSLWCRLKHSIRWTVATLLLAVVVAAVITVSFICLKFWKQRREKQEKKFFDLVEKVIDILQDAEVNERAVIHLRDTLIPLKERKEKNWLWDKVVSFIEENESRVQVINKVINGEEFKVWRWLPSPSINSETGKPGKVWQGQAFSSLSKGKNHIQCSPTPCLKIRNMFDSEVEYGDDWQIYIQDAILEKCEGNNGIVHIAVDPTSSEGCVYLMCNSPQNAGKAFNALHGWWFDGKLVTVKFLRLLRYLERFPDAAACSEPLKPSNNKRLSLSAPFFSSALERS